jgi:hypothetical protein
MSPVSCDPPIDLTYHPWFVDHVKSIASHDLFVHGTSEHFKRLVIMHELVYQVDSDGCGAPEPKSPPCHSFTYLVCLV